MRTRLPTVLLAFGVVAVLAGCQEQSGQPAGDQTGQRPIHLDKGVYQGAPDTPLTPEQVRALQQRSSRQSF